MPVVGVLLLINDNDSADILTVVLPFASRAIEKDGTGVARFTTASVARSSNKPLGETSRRTRVEVRIVSDV